MLPLAVRPPNVGLAVVATDCPMLTVTDPVEPLTDTPVPAINPVTPLLVIVTDPVDPLRVIPEPAVRDVTEFPEL